MSLKTWNRKTQDEKNAFLKIINEHERYSGTVEDSKTSRNMCEDLLGYSHKQGKK